MISNASHFEWVPPTNPPMWNHKYRKRSVSVVIASLHHDIKVKIWHRPNHNSVLKLFLILHFNNVLFQCSRIAPPALSITQLSLVSRTRANKKSNFFTSRLIFSFRTVAMKRFYKQTNKQKENNPNSFLFQISCNGMFLQTMLPLEDGTSFQLVLYFVLWPKSPGKEIYHHVH